MSNNDQQEPQPYFGDFEQWIDNRVKQADRELSEQIAARVAAANQRLARSPNRPHWAHYVAEVE